MAQGNFTKEEAKEILVAVNEVFEAIPRTRRMDFLGHLNDICLFLESCTRECPSESKVKEKA